MYTLLLRFQGCRVELAGLTIRQCAEVTRPLLGRQIPVELGTGVRDQVRGAHQVLRDQQICCATYYSQETPAEYESHVQYLCFESQPSHLAACARLKHPRATAVLVPRARR